MLMVLLFLLLADNRQLAEQGARLYNQREFARAAELFQKAVEATPEGPARKDLVRFLAQSYYFAGNTSAALPWLVRLNQSGQAGLELLNMLRNSYLNLRQPKQARASFH